MKVLLALSLLVLLTGCGEEKIDLGNTPEPELIIETVGSGAICYTHYWMGGWSCVEN